MRLCDPERANARNWVLMIWVPTLAVHFGGTRSRHRQPYEYLLVHQAVSRRLVGTHTYHVQIALDVAASASFKLLHPASCVDRRISLLYTHEKEALVCGRGMVRAVGQRARQTRLTNAKSQVGSRGRPLTARLPFAVRTQLQRGRRDESGGKRDESGGKRWQFRREHLKHTSSISRCNHFGHVPDISGSGAAARCLSPPHIAGTREEARRHTR